MPDLILLRAVTVVDWGGDGDILDYRWLLGVVFESGRLRQFPLIDDEELDWLVKAAHVCVWAFGRSLDCCSDCREEC